jgi:hypothetical protein
VLLELYVLFKCAATGFVAAGLLASFYQLVTNRTPRFVPDFEGMAGVVGASFLCAVVGPFIIMRNAIRGHRIEQRPIGWLAASSAIAFGWSTCSGLIVLYTIVTLM